MPQHEPPPSHGASALAAHAAMVAALRRPGACGGWPGEVGLIETHISTLLLAGPLVYKLKKPVALAFVDFSTIDLRHDACQQELRLNRRTAPRWYLGVVPVRQTDAGPVIDPPAAAAGASAAATSGAPSAAPTAAPTAAPAACPVIDWAVQMRRFDDSQLFDRLARDGRLGAEPVDRLAAVVAQFHGHLSPAPPGYGRADAIRHTARENLSELAPLVAGDPLAIPVAAMQAWTEARGAALAALIDLRRRTGHVREVHGDLHLGNIVWADGTAVLFDALEFSDTLRHIDTVGDLAFTFMDLLAHGLPRLAWRFVSAALEAEADWAALPLLAWWAVHRAAVRAKVALLSAPAPADAAARAAAQARANDYLAVAAALAAPAPAMLVLMMGLSGSGKSAVAGQLAEQLGGVRLRSDVERKRLFGLAPTARATPALGLYTREATRRTYERLQDLADMALQAGVTVVIDAASLRRDERDAMRALARRLGVAFSLVLCDAPPAVLQERLTRRQATDADASDATVEVLARQQLFTEWPAADEAGDLLRINTDRPWAALALAVDVVAGQFNAGRGNETVAGSTRPPYASP